jgi:PAS domain S-box-containing protein
MLLRLRPSLRFIWLPLLVMLLVVAAVYLAVRWRAVQDLGATNSVRVEQRAVLLADQMEASLLQVQLQLTQLSRRTALRRLGDVEALRSDLEWLQGRSSAFAWIGIARPDGIVSVATRGWLEGLSIADRPVFRDARDKPFFADFHPPLLLQKHVLGPGPGVTSVADMGVPILDADGQLLAVVVAHLDRAWFESVGNRSVSAAEVDKVGFGWHVLDSQGEPISGALPFAVPPGQAARTARVAGLGSGSEYWVAVRPLPLQGINDRLQWTALVSLRIDAAEATIRSFDAWLGAATFAALLVAAGLGYLVLRALTRPYDRLIDVVTKQYADTPERGVDLKQYIDSVSRNLALQASPPGSEAESQLLLRIARDAQQLRQLLDSLASAVCILGADNTLVYANARFNQWFGHQFAQRSPVDIAVQLAQAAETDEDGSTAAALELRRADGKPLFLSPRLRNLDDAEPTSNKVLVARDVTDQVLSQRETLEVAERMQIFEDTVLDYGFIMLDEYTLVRDWSKGAEHIVGWSAERAMGIPFAQLFASDATGENAPQAVLRRADEPEGAGFEAPWVHAAGQRVIARGTAYRLLHRQGIARYAVVITDATVSSEAARRLQESEERLSAIIAAASDVIVSTDAKGRITLFNPAAERVFGRPASEVLGGPLDVLMPPSARTGHLGWIEAFGQSGVTRRAMGTGVVEGVAADGTPLALQAAVSKARVRGELAYTAILRDVTAQVAIDEREKVFATERAALLQRLLEQEKETTQKLAQTLHDDLGQTIGALRFFFDAHVERLRANPESVEAVARLDGLIGDLNVQVRSALAELRPPLLDELGLVAALDNEVASRSKDFTSLRVSLDGDTAMRWPADVEYAAFMIAREALNNAGRHSGATELDILVEGDENALRVVVVDNGTGIDGMPGRSFAGHLGLVSMRERAAAVGASLGIESSAEDGTEVTLDWRRYA